MRIFPAIDILGGKVVRLCRGEYEDVRRYEICPFEAVRSFAAAGATALHIVDLDGAKEPENSNFELISSVVSSTDMYTEVGGGIRDMDRARRYIEAGASRVILGTAALKDPEFLARAVSELGDRVCVGVDFRDGFVATDGWTETSDTDAFGFCRSLFERSVTAVICTDISRDGMLKGANIEAYRRLSEIKGLKITASGGISTLEEVAALAAMGLDGAIIGKAMYEGLIDLSLAVRIARENTPC